MAILEVETKSGQEMVSITRQLDDLVKKSGWKDGLCQLFVLHTTAAVTVNENADPDVLRDILYALEKIVPTSDSAYRHLGGDSAAHLKASLMGFSQSLLVREGQLALGQWQEVLFCEFSGPRRRQLLVEFLPGAGGAQQYRGSHG